MDTTMKFASALVADEPDFDIVCQSLIAQVRLQLDNRDPDLVMMFVSPHFTGRANKLANRLRTALTPQLFMGCSGESVIGQNREIEQRAAVAVMAACLPDVILKPFLIRPQNWRLITRNPDDLQDLLDLPADSKLAVLLADPFSSPMDRFLPAFNRLYPNLPIIGGMVSGSYRPGGNALILNDQVITAGVVGLAFAGPLEVDVIVSQGCRPIGEPLKVTMVDQNVILKLADHNPFDYLRQLINELSEEDQELLQHGLFIGRAIKHDADSLGRGDFLIRGVLGIDQHNGSLMVGDYLKQGEFIQFHLRDASTAAEDLEMMLMPQMFYDSPVGGLLFTCNGRGTKLYDHPDGDIGIIQGMFKELNVAGFFCAGEIGPIGNQNFLHGHTASLALFRSLVPANDEETVNQ